MSDFVKKDYSAQINLAQPFVASMAETFSVLGKELAMKSASLGSRKCDLLGDQERDQIREIVDQLLKTKDKNGHPMLYRGMWLEEGKKTY
ncbi:MAG: hypothetical protein LBK24_00935 [Puniceicoccales bacterium]|jgi:hypothetical protein|nr:hypothetical protein [Puniceicoccales bacterium]